MVCNKKIWMNIVEATGVLAATTCSDTAIVTATCKTKVANCGQSFCTNNTATKKARVGCRQCMKGYVGATQMKDTHGTKALVLGYSTCTLTGHIKNCALSMYNNALHCYTCNSGFAVASIFTSCKAFTLDSNCR